MGLGSYFSEAAAGMLSEPVMMLEMMVTTVEASVKLTFTRFTSSFTFVTTLDTWGRGEYLKYKPQTRVHCTVEKAIRVETA